MLGRFASARKLKWIARGKRRRERKVLKGREKDFNNSDIHRL